MKISRPVLIFFTLAFISLSIPIFMGQIPSMPRKSGGGWTPVISMRTNSDRFWRYEASAAIDWLIIFSMYLFTKIRKGDDASFFRFLCCFSDFLHWPFICHEEKAELGAGLNVGRPAVFATILSVWIG